MGRVVILPSAAVVERCMGQLRLYDRGLVDDMVSIWVAVVRVHGAGVRYTQYLEGLEDAIGNTCHYVEIAEFLFLALTPIARMVPSHEYNQVLNSDIYLIGVDDDSNGRPAYSSG